MLQDLAFGRLESEFRNAAPSDGASVVCFQDNRVLICRDKHDALHLPTYAQVREWAEQKGWAHWNEESVQYVFRLHDVDYFIWMGDSGESGGGDFAYESVQQLRQIVSKDICYAVMTAWHLYVWYRDNRYCGRCGTVAVHDDKERMMRCPNCGNMIFPKIAPAVIVAEHHIVLRGGMALRRCCRIAFERLGIVLCETVPAVIIIVALKRIIFSIKHPAFRPLSLFFLICRSSRFQYLLLQLPGCT